MKKLNRTDKSMLNFPNGIYCQFIRHFYLFNDIDVIIECFISEKNSFYIDKYKFVNVKFSSDINVSSWEQVGFLYK